MRCGASLGVTQLRALASSCASMATSSLSSKPTNVEFSNLASASSRIERGSISSANQVLLENYYFEYSLSPLKRVCLISLEMLRPVKSPVLDFKILFLALLMLGVLATISIRLWFIQIRLNVYYCSRIQGHSEVTVRIPAIRGEIRDRDGVVLATNRPSYCVEFFLPDLVSGYAKRYGQPQMIEFQTEDSNKMLRERKEADIVTILERTIIPRLKQLKVAEPYNAKRLRTHYRNN